MSDGEAPANRAQRRKLERAQRREKNLSKKRRQQAREKASKRTDDDRRARLRELDDASPIRPSKSDLVLGRDAVRELGRIRKQGRRA